MEPFKKIDSTAVPLLIENIDTDQIIPARFLKATSREGFGDNLFRDWRFNKDETPKADFPLNNPTYSGEVLLAGSGFGCGSSREHAAWAIFDYGFRAIISVKFADIFKNNALNNGLLPIEVSEAFFEELTHCNAEKPTTKIQVDLENQTVSFNGKMTDFKIDTFKKQCILEGKDELDYLIDKKNRIKEFEHEHA